MTDVAIAGSRPKVRIDRDVEMETSDGTVLRADVWRTDDGLPRPAVLVRTAYNRSIAKNELLPPMRCVDGGYAFVIQDTRGCAGSDGSGGVDGDQEATDTHDSVEWVAAQPWCDGNVFMAGASYLGIAQLLGAARRPPHLKGIAPAMTSSAELDRELGGGVPRLNDLVVWLAFQSLDWVNRAESTGERAGTIRDLWQLVLDPGPALTHLPLRELPQLSVPSLPFDFAELLDTGTPAIAERFEYADISVPTLSITGWFDSFCGATIESFRRLRTQGGGGAAVRSRHRLVVGPWAHSTSLTDHLGEISFTAQADPAMADTAGEQLGFFAAQLDGSMDQGPAVRYFLMGADHWCTAETWPPPDSGARTWYLDSGGNANSAGDGTLSTAPPSWARHDRYDYDPADPVPSHGGRVPTLGRMVPGPLDRSRLQTRADMLCYTSAPLERGVDVVGPIEATLFLASSAPDTDVVARLVDAFPDGRALSVAEGIQRGRHRPEGAPKPDVVEPYAVHLGHTAWRFPVGHRLRLEVTSSDFPAYDRNMNTGAPIGTDTAGIVAQQALHHGPDALSRLVVHVRDGSDAGDRHQESPEEDRPDGEGFRSTGS